MGRRKIEIKAIKDDRNRSVYGCKLFLPTCANHCRTFLKRKGGLFKKAHELSVLCSVDVAVIIFGHNKKLYEFSSGDISETLTRYSYVRNPPCARDDPANGPSMALHTSTRDRLTSAERGETMTRMKTKTRKPADEKSRCHRST